MFLIRLFRWLLSLPLIWLGQGMALLGQSFCVPLLKAAWRVGGDGSIGLNALARIQHHVSTEAARQQALDWLAVRPQAEIAGYAGLLALGAGEVESARELLALGQQLGRERAGILEMLELLLAENSGDTNEELEVARRFDLRDDLSPSVTKLVCQQLLADDMLSGRVEETRRRAEHLWSIENDPLAATALWVLRQPAADADADLARCLDPLNLEPPTRLYLEVLGNLAAGNLDRGRQLLADLEDLDAGMFQHARRCLEAKEMPA